MATKEFSLSDFYQKNKVWLIGGGLALILILAGMSFFTDWLGDYFTLRSINKIQANINAVNGNVSNITTNLYGLNAENAVKTNEVQQLNGTYSNAKEQTNNAKNETNGALFNYNSIANMDFNGTSYAESNAARCRANPSGKGC